MKLIATFLLFIFCLPDQQFHPGIKISVRKEKRSIVYEAENTTDKDLDLFFRVESKGFRRSADRPMITTIPAKKKIDLLEMIPLTKDADTVHTYTAIVTQKDNNLNLQRSDSVTTEVRRIRPDSLGY
ncbi:hypothetical protein [Nonlabens xiamenensis]|uniref:hypothetical protein n=1 Tax=Nonlabens xiamenensis TaxID=2341043 RepID=UPI000F604B8E|nr:hypothetical protein [Nonlabens xiamenensis]